MVRAIILSFLWLIVFNKCPSSLILTLCIYIATLFVSFTYVNKRGYEKAVSSVVGFYCIQRIELNVYFVSVIALRYSII